MIRVLLYTVLYATFNVFGAAIIKYRLKGKNLVTINDWSKFLIDLPFILAFLLIMFSALALFKALSTSNFSFIIPIATGINFILTVAVGYYLFKDKLSLSSILGFLLIISGIIILSIKNQAHE